MNCKSLESIKLLMVFWVMYEEFSLEKVEDILAMRTIYIHHLLCALGLISSE